MGDEKSDGKFNPRAGRNVPPGPRPAPNAQDPAPKSDGRPEPASGGFDPRAARGEPRRPASPPPTPASDAPPRFAPPPVKPSADVSPSAAFDPRAAKRQADSERSKQSPSPFAQPSPTPAEPSGRSPSAPPASPASSSARKDLVGGTAVDQNLIPGFWKPVAVPSHPLLARHFVGAFNWCARSGPGGQFLGAVVFLAGIYSLIKGVPMLGHWIWDTWIDPHWDYIKGWYGILVDTVRRGDICGLLGYLMPFIIFGFVVWVINHIPGVNALVSSIVSNTVGTFFRFLWSLTGGALVETFRAIVGVGLGGYQKPQTILEGPWDPPTSARVKGDRRNYRAIARTEECEKYQEPKDAFRLGRYVSIRNGEATPSEEMYLPMKAVTHILVAAPSGEGKTRSVVLPFTVSALENDWSVVVFDVKGDMPKSLGGYPKYVAGQDGRPCRLRVWSPDLPLELCDCYNPLESIRDEQTLASAVAAIMGAPPPAGSDGEFWDKQYRQNLKLMIQVAKERLGDLACPQDLYKMATNRPYFELLASGTRFAQELSLLFAKSIDEYAKYIAGVHAAVEVFGREPVHQRTSFSDFSFKDLDRERTLLIVAVPQDYKDMGATLLSLFFNALDAYAARRLRSGFQRKVLVMADEAPTMIKKVDLQNFTAVYRSAGMVATIVAQDPSMLGDEARWQAIAGNCNVFIMLRNGMQKAIEFAQHRIGNMVTVHEESSRGNQMGQLAGNRTFSDRIEKGAAIEVRELRETPTAFGMWTICERLCPKPLLTDTYNEFQELPMPGMPERLPTQEFNTGEVRAAVGRNPP